MQMRNLFLTAIGAVSSIVATSSTADAAAWVPPNGTFGNYVYTGGQDSDGKFGTPTAFDPNNIQLEPLSFRATSVGGTPALTTDTLKVNISTANQAKSIFDVRLTEIGDYTIDNGGGVKAFAGLFVRVLDADWSFTQRVFTADFTSIPGFPLNGTDGAGNWTGGVTVTLPASARSISITINNTLQAHSNPGGSALIQKKEVDITINTPEPATLAAVFSGLGFAAIRRRKA